jgi:hypothetical protein
MSDLVDSNWVAAGERLERLRYLLAGAWAAETDAVLIEFVLSDDGSEGRWELTRKQ